MSQPKQSQLTKAGEVLPKQACFMCGYTVDAATCVDGDFRPQPGDISICLKCGEVSEFGEDFQLREASLNSLLKLSATQRLKISDAQKLIRQNRYIK